MPRLPDPSDPDYEWIMLKRAREAERKAASGQSPSPKRTPVPHIKEAPKPEPEPPSLPPAVDVHPEVVDAKTPTAEPGGRPPQRKVDARRGDRHSKARGRLSLRPDAEILRRFRVFCAGKGIDMTDFFEVAGVHYIDAVDAHQSEMVAAQTPPDEKMMVFKTSAAVINLYLRYNPSNKWKAKDDEAGARYNDADPRLVELGIIQTQFNAQFKRINSFRYYTAEIEQYLSTPLSSETVDIILKQSRARYAAAKAGGV